VHGVRETFDYSYGPDDATWDLDVMTDTAHTVVFLLMVHCNAACYSKYQAEITHLVSSVTASRLAQPHGPVHRAHRPVACGGTAWLTVRPWRPKGW
jgi:hypothetical protein